MYRLRTTCESNVGLTMFEMSKGIIKIFLKCLIIRLHVIFDILVDFIYGLFYRYSLQKVPPIKNRLLITSASELAEEIRKKKISSLEVVTAFIERAKEINEIINAVVEDRYSEALEEAKEVDKFLQELKNVDTLKEKKPFLGVPFTTKESNEAEGMLHTMGLISRRNFRSQEDATVIRFMKDAGGILIAKTNIPELNLWTESRNNLYGQTCNPYNTTRNVGGSSGGEAAVIAACGAAFSIASDIGGSIRMPAFFNGVFGFKPTGDLTPLKGVGLRQKNRPNSMAEAGPICKKAEDLVPLLKVLVGENLHLLDIDAVVDLKDLNIFYQESSGDIRASKVNSEMKAVLLKAVQYFKEMTGSATKIKIPGSQYSYRLWRFWMTQEDLDFKLSITNGKYRANAVTEVFKFLTKKSELTLAAILKLIDEDLLPKEDAKWAMNVTENMKLFLKDKLEGNGILFYPSSPFPAGYHYTAYLRPFNFGYWCIFNVLKFPVCQVPLGVDKNGLPIGVQVVAAPFNDRLCLAVARELERVFGGWVPPA
ncbi:PREDICTED: fatty-acid amide hydrolase 2-like isoform X2 [Habropoda laboriosa]|uniref:fatty-acid amide hydrolase 2-like isoform X2 n=1 Tax=Habropoda laboriosa TaxID=597456 RepID=UPI00083D96D5|nr:PREDICTED: fatty-acid amide hydrolase 2-like isoform X2 [Habropoda laboriosa]